MSTSAQGVLALPHADLGKTVEGTTSNHELHILIIDLSVMNGLFSARRNERDRFDFFGESFTTSWKYRLAGIPAG